MNSFFTTPKPKMLSVENTLNRDSEEPSTEYTIVYFMGETKRFVKISAQSAFKALKIFQELHPVTYKHSSVKEVKKIIHKPVVKKIIPIEPKTEFVRKKGVYSNPAFSHID